MKRPWTWSLRILAAVAVLLVIAWGVQVLVLPSIVRSQIQQRLAAMGLPGVDVHVEGVSLAGAGLRDFVVGEGDRLSVDAIRFANATGPDGSGRRRVLSLIGARFHALYRDGRLDLGPLENIRVPPGDSLIDRVELRSSVLTVLHEGRPYHLALDGWAENVGHGTWRMEWVAIGSGFKVELRGVVGPFGEGSFGVNNLVLAVTSPSLHLSDVEIVPRRFDQPVASLAMAAGEVKFAEVKGVRTLTTPAIRLALSPVDVRRGETHIQGVTATVGFKIDTHSGSVAMLPEGQSVIEIEGVNHGTAADAPTTGPMRWSIAPVAGGDPFAVVGGSGVSWGVKATLEKGSQATAYGARIEPGSLALVVNGRDASLQIREGSVIHPGSGLTLGGIAADVPIAIFTPTPPQPGTVSVATVRYGEKALPPIQGTAVVNRQGLDVTLRLPVAPFEAAKVEVHADAQVIRVHGSLPPVALADLQAVIAGFADLGGVETGGTVAVEAKAEYARGRVTPDIRVTLTDALYRNAESGMAFEGVNGTVHLDGLSPLTTPGGQELKVARYAQGKVVLTDGFVRFRVENNHRVFVERTDWGFGKDGRVTAHAVRYDTDNPSVDTELFVDDLNLEDWLSVLTNERVSATGRLYGRMPLKIKLGDGQPLVSFGKGFLYSKSGTGTMRISDTRQVSKLLADADPRFTADAQLAAVREKLAGALSDFEYSMFRFNLIPQEDGQVTMSVQTRGKGRGADGQEIGGLTVNVNGFGDAANAALFTRDLLGGGIESRLEEFFNAVEPRPDPEDQP